MSQYHRQCHYLNICWSSLSKQLESLLTDCLIIGALIQKTLHSVAPSVCSLSIFVMIESENLRTCRYCLQTEDVTQQNTENLLIAPCKCANTVKYVHRNCLHHWLNRSSNRLKCELCKHSFVLEVNLEHRGRTTAYGVTAILTFLITTSWIFIYDGFVRNSALCVGLKIGMGCGALGVGALFFFLFCQFLRYAKKKRKRVKDLNSSLFRV